MTTRPRSFRANAIAKHGTTCVGSWRCKRKGPLPESEVEADHIIPRWKKGPDTVENSQILCKKHHAAKSAKEAAERARSKKKLKVQRPAVTLLVVLLWVWGMFAIVGWISDKIDGEPTNLLASLLSGWFTTLVAFAVGWAAVGRYRAHMGSAPKSATVPAKDGERERLIETARDFMGPKGEIYAHAGKSCTWILGYEGTGFADHNEEKRLEFDQRLAAKLGGRWRTEWQKNSDEVWITRLEDLGENIPHPGFSKEANWPKLPIGFVTTFNFKKTAHILICGLTGSGKTFTLHTIISSLAHDIRAGAIERLLLADPKQVSLISWEGQPGIGHVATEAEELWELPGIFTAEMDRRLGLHKLWVRSGRTEGVPLSSHKPWVIVIDEYEEFITMMTDHAEEPGDDGKPREKTTQKRQATPIREMGRAARLAREAGMFIILGTQRGDADLIGGRVRNNFGGRILVGRGGSAESIMCFGVSGYGRDIDAIPGRITAQVGEGRPQEDQCFYTPNPGAESHTDAELAILARLGLTGHRQVP